MQSVWVLACWQEWVRYRMEGLTLHAFARGDR